METEAKDILWESESLKGKLIPVLTWVFGGLNNKYVRLHICERVVSIAAFSHKLILLQVKSKETVVKIRIPKELIIYTQKSKINNYIRT